MTSEILTKGQLAQSLLQDGEPNITPLSYDRADVGHNFVATVRLDGHFIDRTGPTKLTAYTDTLNVAVRVVDGLDKDIKVTRIRVLDDRERGKVMVRVTTRRGDQECTKLAVGRTDNGNSPAVLDLAALRALRRCAIQLTHQNAEVKPEDWPTKQMCKTLS